MDKLLFNALIANEGRTFLGYVGIKDSFIEDVGEGLPSDAIKSKYTETDDVDGMLLIPGAIDDQVHFRDPGLIHKADISTESKAAAAGGVTSFMDMPNTNPQTTTIKDWEDKCKRAAEVSAVNYAFFIGGTKDNISELKNADYTQIPGIKVFLGSSTGNMLVDNEKALDEIFSLGELVAIHSEDENIIRENSLKAKEDFPDGVPIDQHPLIRSRQACIKSTHNAVERAKRLGTRLHILHLSTAEECDMLEEKPLHEKRITAEACIPHIWFESSDYHTLGALIKCNPAVKESTDRDAIRRALRKGIIDIVATDHAPHLLTDKNGDALTSASGMPSVQFSLPLMLELSRNGIFSIEKVVDLMCHKPACLFGIEKRGFIRKGYYADLVIINPTSEWTITNDLIQSKCGWSPWLGVKLHYKVAITIVNGNEVYRNGEIVAVGKGLPLRFNHKASICL